MVNARPQTITARSRQEALEFATAHVDAALSIGATVIPLGRLNEVVWPSSFVYDMLNALLVPYERDGWQVRLERGAGEDEYYLVFQGSSSQ